MPLPAACRACSMWYTVSLLENNEQTEQAEQGHRATFRAHSGASLERQTVTINSALAMHGRSLVLALVGAVLLAAALALGGGSDLLVWGAQSVFQWPLRLLALTALYSVPGLALLRLLWPREHALPLAAHLALAAGISTALPSLCVLAAHLLHLPWNGVTTWGYVLASVVVVVWPARAASSSIPDPASDDDPSASPWLGAGWNKTTGWLLPGIFGVALLVRLYSVRDLPTGLFGDSYHHTMITQLLIDNQGLFQSWQPYAPLATFTYHFGFHSNAAFIHWSTGMDAIQSVLWAGQILNALTVAMAAVLVAALGSTAWGSVWAALLTGFVSTLPAYYVNWGRYTQLTGHIVLVVVVVCWIALVEKPEPAASIAGELRARWRPLLLAALLTAAMILTHYLVTVFAALFVGSYLLVLILLRQSWHTFFLVVVLSAVATLLALLFAAPWLYTVFFKGYLTRNATGFVRGFVEEERVVQYSMIPMVVPLYSKHYILGGALVGLVVAGWRRHWRIALLALWSVLLVMCAMPQVVGLPGSGIIDHLTALGAWHLTLPLLAAYAIAAGQEQVRSFGIWLRLPRFIGTLVALLAVVAVIGWGVSWQVAIVDDSARIVTHTDMRAMAWIRKNTPSDARFLVNSFPAYGGTVVAGTDAGWWLPLLTGRQSSLPPITYGTEWGEEQDYATQVNRLATTLRGHPLTNLSPLAVDLTTPAVLRALREEGIDYIYSGAHASPGPDHADHIDTALLRASPSFRLVYEQGGVEIFEFVAAQNEEEEKE